MNYWAGKIAELGGKGEFLRYRAGGYPYRIEQFPDFEKEKGLGLDYGCGCISIFEWSDKDVVAVDPLVDEYQKLIGFNNTKNIVAYTKIETEVLPFEDESLDWIFNYNVIDHTPDPQRMADEMYRVLKPGGAIYFQVNFDDNLSPSHYDLWNKEMVEKVMEKFTLVYDKQHRSPVGYEQDLYFAKYVK